MTRKDFGSWLERITGTWQFWITIGALVMTFNITRSVMSSLPPPLPVLGTIESFELLDQHGENYGSKNLKGHAWVANFIFTRCTTICPAFTAKMSEIQHRSRGLGTSFHMVSFSVDPEHDTPEVLKAYATKHRASSVAWSFLTGPMDEVKKTVVDGLKMAMGGEITDGNFEGIFHGSHFVLVDAEGRIRGYYDSNDDDSVERVLHDVGWLMNLPNPPRV